LQFLIQYAFALLARTHRYHYGGDDPIQGFDCSGFVGELLKAAGELPWNAPKMSAQQIHDFYDRKVGSSFAAGSLAFYGSDILHIDHVAFCLDSNVALEAAGGDATTISDAKAIQQNAFIKMRPIRYRKDFLCVLKPNYFTLGMMK
jgi:cell wall-associated NlpC family hydrolase